MPKHDVAALNRLEVSWTRVARAVNPPECDDQDWE